MEIELKLAISPVHLARLRRQPLLTGITSKKQLLHSVYFDTPDFALTRRRVAWRLRRIGYCWVQTLKAAAPAVGALSSRPEWEIQVAGNTPDLAVLPPEALALLEGIALDRLAPVFTTEVKRTLWILTLGETTMEIALDQGEVRAGEAHDPISEIELELKSGPPDGLFTAALALLQRVPLRIDSRSKASRGYRLAGAVKAAPTKANWPKLEPTHAAGSAWSALVETATSQLVDNLPGFLEHPEEIEYLHQVRVALRRLLSLAGLLPEEPVWLEALHEQMEVLNPARDWDVFLHQTLPRLELPPDPAFLEGAQAMAAAARQAAQTSLAGDGFTRSVLLLGQSLLTPPKIELTAIAWASQALARRWKSVQRRARDLDGGVIARHRLRIAVKKMRYASDALCSLYGKRAASSLARLEAVQESLGALNDLAVAERLMRALSLAHPECAYSAGRVVGLLSAKDSPDANPERELAAIQPYWHS